MSDDSTSRTNRRSDGTEFRYRGEELDEIVARDVRYLHFEQMGESQFWMLIELANGEQWHVNFGAKNERAKGYSFIQANGHYANEDGDA